MGQLNPSLVVSIFLFSCISGVTGFSEADVISKDNQSILEESSPAPVHAGSGTVSEVNLNSLARSDNWAGVYGNASGRYLLGSSGSELYSWGSSRGKYVYFDEDSIDFGSNWSPANLTYMNSEYPFLLNSTTEEASVTFNRTVSVESVFQAGSVDNTVASHTFNGTGQPFWKTAYLTDGYDGFFTAIVDDSTSYSGKPADYQAILPENGYASSEPTSFNVWIELE